MHINQNYLYKLHQQFNVNAIRITNDGAKITGIIKKEEKFFNNSDKFAYFPV